MTKAKTPPTETPTTEVVGTTNKEWCKLVWEAKTKCFISVAMPGGAVWIAEQKMALQNLLQTFEPDSVDFENHAEEGSAEWRLAPVMAES